MNMNIAGWGLRKAPGFVSNRHVSGQKHMVVGAAVEIGTKTD